jgi:hypothetical protein
VLLNLCSRDTLNSSNDAMLKPWISQVFKDNNRTLAPCFFSTNLTPPRRFVPNLLLYCAKYLPAGRTREPSLGTGQTVDDCCRRPQPLTPDPSINNYTTQFPARWSTWTQTGLTSRSSISGTCQLAPSHFSRVGLRLSVTSKMSLSRYACSPVIVFRTLLLIIHSAWPQ